MSARIRLRPNGHTGGSVATEQHIPTAPTTTAGVALAAVAAVGDPDGTRVVTAIVALLAVIGIVLLMTAVWLYRATRPDPELLAPLEIMGDRSWRRADPVWQRRRLDEVRPQGAEPLEPSVAPPDLDEAFDRGPVASGFDDLHDSAHQDAAADASVAGDPLVVSPAAPPVNDPTTDPTIDPTGAVERNPSVRIESRPITISTAPPGTQWVPPVTTSPLPPDPSAAPQRPAPLDPLIARSLDGASTPTGITRPTPEDLPDHDVDPALLAAAMAQLDAELGRLRRTTDPDRDGG